MKYNDKKRILLVLAVLCLFLVIPSTFAGEIANETISADNDADLTVDENVIYVSNDDINGDGSQASPYNSVSTAVLNYNSSENSKIHISNGNYIISEPIELDKDINIVGQSREGAVLDANFQNSIFKVTQKSKITFTNLTFKNADNAAALFIDFGSEVSVDNCIFENNLNGAIYHRPTFSNSITLAVDNCIFKDNMNTADGAAIHIHSSSVANITNSIFENNQLPTGESDVSDGGAIYAGGNLESMLIDSCIFRGNVAVRGSAVSQYCAGDLYIYNSLFENNTSPGSSKYKINSSVISFRQSNTKELTLYLVNNTIRDNSLNDEIFTDGNVKVIYPDKNTKITANKVEKILGDDFNFIVELAYNNGTPIAGKEIITTFTNTLNNNVTVVSNITDSNGRVTIILNDFKPGKYKVVSSFEGDGELDDISAISSVDIKTENSYNLVLDPDHIRYTEGDSYNATIYIYDEYMMPINKQGEKFSIYWENYYNNHTMVLEMNSIWVEGNTYTFDINRCHLITRDVPYVIEFRSSNLGSVKLTVDMSKDLSNIDTSLEVIYVSKDGSDVNGTGSKDKPLLTVQTALIANNYLGGGKTVFVEEGTYEFSTFTILGNVTVIGEKSKTVLKQGTGKLGMFEIEQGNTVSLVNITFINGFATPEPEGLIHVCEDSILYVDGCEFSNNSAIDGGAIAVSTGASAYINNSYFHDNHAYLNRIGGAIYVDRGYLYVANSLFENNIAGEGGAIFLGFPSEADIVNSTFIRNNATGTDYVGGAGGAIFTRSSNLNVYNSTFIENFAPDGGAIYIDYGDAEIYQSYFENNRAKGSEAKGTAVQGSYASYCNMTIHYSVLISGDERNDNYYLVYIPNIDENYTADSQYNYWKSNSPTSNAGTANSIKIQITPSNEFVYSGDVVEFTVEFVNYNVENGTSNLNSSVHDLALEVIPALGSVDKSMIVIKDNKAKFLYFADAIGQETIYFDNILTHARYKFNVEDGSDKIKINATVGFDVNRTTTITVDFDAPLNDNITIRICDDYYPVYVDGNKAVLKVNTTPGEYDVNVIFSGNGIYKGFSLVDSFAVDKYPSTVEVSDLTVYYNGRFEAKLTDAEGNPISGEKLIIIIDKEYSATTDENGVAALDLNLASVGNYPVTTKFNGNSMYLPSNASSTLTVEFINVKLAAGDNSAVTPLGGEFSFILTDGDGNPIKDTEVIISVEDINATVKTDDAGIATIDLKDNMLSVGSHEISANVLESAVYGSASLKSTLTVVKAKASLNASDVTVFAYKGEFTVNLTDSNGNPIANQSVIFDFNNKSEIIKTDENGTATLKLDLAAGNYSATVKLEENGIYEADDIAANIHVKEDKLIIDAPDVVVYFSQGKFTVTLRDENGQAIVGQRIIVTINNNDYIATTDENGTASVNIDLPLGEYTAVTRFDGNDDYKAGNVTSKISVLSSIESSDMKRAYNSPYAFNATLKDSNGNPVANSTVELIVNGKSYNLTSDENGVVLLTQKLAVGTYAITVTNPTSGEKTANYAQIVKRITNNKNLNMYFGAGSSYKVKVFDDDGKAVGAGEIVVMKVNGKTYKVKTNKNGYAALKLSLKPKTYTITATYKGVKVSNKIVVKPVLTAKNISKKKAKKIKFSAKLVSTKGKALKGKKISFTIKGKTYKAKTNKKGVATVTLKNLKVGKHTIKVKYGKSTIKKTIKIKK